jgi:hypothetical protein
MGCDSGEEPVTNPWFKRIFGALGGVFVTWGLVRAWQEGVAVLPSPAVIVAALLLSSVGVVAASFSWAALFPDHEDPSRLRRAFVGSQIGKHLPLGGLAQAVGQTELSRDATMTRRRASHGFVVHALVQVTSVLLVISGVALDSGLPAWWRIGGVLALVLFVVLLRGGIEVIARFVGKRFRLDRLSLPPHEAVVKSTVLSLIPVLAGALTFAVILNEIEPATRVMASVPQFAIGWLGGYLAVPFPAGLGIREAVLVSALGLPLGVVVSASVAHRLITLAVEGVLAAVAWRNLSAQNRLKS